MRKRILAVVAKLPIVLLLAGHTYGQQAPAPNFPTYVENTIFVESPFPATFKDIKVEGFAPLKAALSVQDEGAKVNFAPFLAFSNKYRDIYSESRFQLAYKDNIATLGVSWKLNPAHPLSSNGSKEFRRHQDSIPAFEEFAQKDYYDALVKRLKPTMKALDASIKSLNEARTNDLRNTALRDSLLKERQRKAVLADSIQELESLSKNIVDVYQKAFDEKLLNYYEVLSFTRKPVFGFSATSSLFPTLAGRSVDKDSNSFNDNEHPIKSWTIAPTLDWRVSLHDQFSLLAGPQWSQKSADGSSQYANYFNFGVTYGRVLFILNKKNNAYKKTEAYKTSFFIPSVVAGLSWEYSRCYRGKAIDDIGLSNAVTLFFDFKIAEKAMFRIGIPYKFQQASQGNTDEAGLVTQLSLQLKGL